MLFFLYILTPSKRNKSFLTRLVRWKNVPRVFETKWHVVLRDDFVDIIESRQTQTYANVPAELEKTSLLESVSGLLLKFMAVYAVHVA